MKTDTIKNQLELHGYFIIENIASAVMLSDIYSELKAAFKSDKVITVNKDGINIFTLNGDDLLNESKLTAKLYQIVLDMLRANFPSLVELEDKKIGVSANFMENDQQQFRFHFDRHQLTVVVYLNECLSLPLALYPLIREDPRTSENSKLKPIDNVEPVKIYPTLGKVVVFWGRRTLHGVLLDKKSNSKVLERYSLQFGFDLSHYSYDNESYYGRTNA
jgi:hypothetical protein